jgi:cytochrome c oxidase subunit 2
LLAQAGGKGDRLSFDIAALAPAGPRAREIANLMLVFTGISAIVYVLVIAVLVWAMLRKRAGSEGADREAQDRRARKVIGVCTAVTVLILATLGLMDFAVQHRLSARPADAMKVTITAHQFWWEVEYADDLPARRLRTANEVHIPTQRPVELVLKSNDVIHSVWLPNLIGKKDLIPGRTNTEIVVADRPGTFVGQCAEFCGLQHAQMRLVLHADSPGQFDQWRQQQLEAAHEPANDSEARGRAVFMNSTCVLCHTIRGTGAGALVGPDLTHIGSRATLAAGTLPNTPGTLASWILAPQRVKPGSQMPSTALKPDDLATLTQYLVSLK